MKKVFLITDDDTLHEAVAECVGSLSAEVETTDRWSQAKDALFKERYDAVCIDYDAIKIEGLDAFILLDNVLQKEQTAGVLILRKPSQRAKQFISSLDSFRDSIELDGAQPSRELLEPALSTLLEESAATEVAADAGEGDSEQTTVEVRLPSFDEGSLATTGLGRILYALAQACASGVLALKNGSIQRRYAIREGEPVEVDSDDFAALSTLASAFAWQDGQYRFEEGWQGEGEAVEPLRFIYRSLDRHVPQRQVMQSMMTHMQAFPTITNLWSKRRDKLAGLEVVERFFDACDGQTTLEKALASLGSDATAGFKATLFAQQTDLIMLRSQATPGGVAVQYDASVEQAQQERVEAEKKASKAYRATGSGRLDLERELREYLDEIEQATPYEIFDVWEGCGRQAIQNNFYTMVKSHHPDVYGGNVSGDVKQLAQEIFIAIKDAYTELIKVENEQTRPDPRQKEELGAELSSEAMTRPSTTTDAAGASQSADSTSERAASTPSSGRADSTASFGAEQADGASSSGATAAEDGAARKSRVERLKAKRRSTPIGLGREPSTPIVKGKTRKSTLRENTEERQARLNKIRRNSTANASDSADPKDKANQAKKAFNKGYKAFRENDNHKVAFEHFSVAYNLEPSNGKYLTFYGYLLFLTNPDRRKEAHKVLDKAIELGDRQSLPDAHVFVGHILKVEGKEKSALRHFKQALKLNPKSREAQRELRLYQMRKGSSDDDGDDKGFLKNLFKK